MNIVAGIDLGTQSLKAVLYDYEQKRIVAQASCPLDLISKEDGTREQKPEWYDAALKSVFEKLPCELRSQIQAVGVSGQQHGFVPLDKDGQALYNVKLWNDTSTAEECRILTDKAGGNAEVIKEVGNLMLPGFTAPKILWLKKHFPDGWKNVRYILLPHDYINYVLTGSYVMEAGDASGTALFNPVKRRWSRTLCSLIDEGLYDLLAPLIASDTKAGTVSQKAAGLLGIPEGIPVSSGGGDNMMGAIGTGTVSDGFLTMSMGTSGTLYGYSDKPIADPERGLSGFCSSTGGWLPLLCTMNCTVATEQIRSLFGLPVAEFNRLAAAAEPGAQGVRVLPFFNGERTPNLPKGRASITGLTMTNSNKENICRAAMESAVFALKGGLDAFKKLGFEPKEIRLIGGGAKSPLWRQIAADIMNVPVSVPVSEEAAAMGAAVQALWCLEGGTPERIKSLCAEHIQLSKEKSAEPGSAVCEYEQAYRDYNEILEQLTPLYVYG
ncbi:xylulokinase [Treponema sp. OMZ 305]|uniref:xylulokinase n=1 Tax=Treponema sp. OMZ 305 TaxID=1659192 RepID=UPI0020A3CE28|nr:xylulokinase [Treponema sp. OMZ 305]UTC58134.1 xylulokinase [Treponema sp. OMZ 305]